MEGVIVKFKEEHGFGFIEGEDSNQYFFHKNRIDQKFFSKNTEGVPLLFNYYLCDYKLEENIPIYLLEFDPYEGEKGLIATNIKQKNIIMNSEETEFIVQITDLKFENNYLSYYDNHPNNGAIARNYDSVVWMSYKKIGGYGKGKVDIRSKILEINNRKKITTSLVEKIYNNILNKKINVNRYRDINVNIPSNISDVVFRGNQIVHTTEQYLLNLGKEKNQHNINKLYFDYNILKI